MRETEEAEIIVPFRVARERLGVCTQVRSTLVTSSLDTLRKRGRFDRYEALLDPAYKDEILSTVAGVWLPMRVARAHYEAVDRLGFSPSEAVENGYAVGERIHGTFLGTMVKMAASSGVTPWFGLGYMGKLYTRLFGGGGGTMVKKMGPKDAYAEIAGMPLASLPYFHAAFRGMVQAGCDLFCTKSYAHEVPVGSSPTTAALRISWA